MRWGGSKRKLALVVLLLVVVATVTVYHRNERAEYQRSLRGVESALDQRDFTQARADVERCLALRPDDPAVHILAARVARRGGDYEAARRELDTATRLRGTERELRAEQRFLDIQSGADRDGAGALMDRCLNGSEDSDTYLALEVAIAHEVVRLEAAYNSGMTLVEGPAGAVREKTERAIDLWLQLRTGPADRAQGLYWRGLIAALTNHEAAINSFRAALDLNAEHFDARLHLASALVEYDAREAIRHLESLRKRNNQHKQVGLLLANLRRGLGQLPEAQQLLDELLVGSPNDPIVLLERGKVALDAGLFAESADFLQRALVAAPNEPFVHLALSRALHLSGKEDEARRHQQRYNEIESERMRVERIQSEEQRAAWRKRVELELLRKSSAPTP